MVPANFCARGYISSTDLSPSQNTGRHTAGHGHSALILSYAKQVRKKMIQVCKNPFKTAADLALLHKRLQNSLIAGSVKKDIHVHCEAAGIISESKMMYYFVYFQAGFTFALKRWIDTGCKESAEEIAQIIKNCVPAIWKNT